MKHHSSRRFGATPRRQGGQGVVEFVVVIVVFGTLLLGIFQAALLYRAKSVVDYAAFQAARQGSLHGATQDSVDHGLAKGLAPLFAKHATAGGLVDAVAMAKDAELQNMARVAIISPTQQMFHQVAQKQFDGVMAIPNDDLAYRDDATRAANVLKVKVTYDYPLIVPVLDRVIGAIAGSKKAVVHADGSIRTMWVLPIQSQAIVRMQSPIRDADALGGNGATTGGNPPSGNGNPPGGNPPGGTCT